MQLVPSLALIFKVFALLLLKNSSFADAAFVWDQETDPEGIVLQRDIQDTPRFSVPFQISHQYGTLSRKMLLSLTNSQIIFPDQSCSKVFFEPSIYRYFQNPPSKTAIPVAIEHLHFSATGKPGNITLGIQSPEWGSKKDTRGLDIPLWNLDTEAIIVSDCKTDQSFPSTFKDGIFGMGTEGSRNLSRTFSLDVKIWNDKTILYFGFRPELIKPAPPIVFPADSKWQISSKQGSLTFGNHSIPLSGKVLFDVNFDDIILPLDVWNSLFERFNNSYGPCYQGNPYGFNCSEKMDVTKIPPLRLVLDDKIIELPHQVFSDFFYTDSLDIYFTPSNTSVKDFSGVPVYVRPLFNDTIILGARFMTYYHAVFKSDQGSNSIEIYQRRWNYIPTKKPKSKQAEKPEQSRNIGEIAGPVFGIGALICICFLCCYSMKSEDGSLLKQSDQSLGNEGQLLQGEQTNLLLKSPKRESEIVL